MAASVAVGGLTGLGDSLSDRVAIGIVTGLLVGKPIVSLLDGRHIAARRSIPPTPAAYFERAFHLHATFLQHLNGQLDTIVADVSAGTGDHRAAIALKRTAKITSQRGERELFGRPFLHRTRPEPQLWAEVAKSRPLLLDGCDTPGRLLLSAGGEVSRAAAPAAQKGKREIILNPPLEVRAFGTSRLPP